MSDTKLKAVRITLEDFTETSRRALTVLPERASMKAVPVANPLIDIVRTRNPLPLAGSKTHAVAGAVTTRVKPAPSTSWTCLKKPDGTMSHGGLTEPSNPSLERSSLKCAAISPSHLFLAPRVDRYTTTTAMMAIMTRPTSTSLFTGMRSTHLALRARLPLLP